MKKVEITDEYMGVSQLLGWRMPGLPPPSTRLCIYGCTLLFFYSLMMSMLWDVRNTFAAHSSKG